MTIPALIMVIFAYLIGSISFAVVVSKLMGLADPHSYGSGNPGATNVLRSGSKTAAALTLLGDAVKGWLAVFVALLLKYPEEAMPTSPRRFIIISRAVEDASPYTKLMAKG